MEVTRAVASVVFSGVLANELDEDWHEGPLELSFRDVVTGAERRSDRAARLNYFHPRTNGILYGEPTAPCRWHKSGPLVAGEMMVAGVEVLNLPRFSGGPGDVLAIVHIDLPAARPQSALAEFTNSRTRTEAQQSDLVRLLSPIILNSRESGFPVSYVESEGELEGIVGLGYTDWCAQKQWLWAMATAAPLDQPSIPALRPDPEDPTLDSGYVYLSSSWRAMVLRSGASFVGNERAETQDEFLSVMAPLYVRTIYLDAILLGLLQERGLNQFAERLSRLDERSARHAEIPNLEDDLTLFRNTLWWQHITRAGPANGLLIAYQAQHRLPELLEQIVAEFSEYARQVDASSNLRTSAALGLLTLVGLPLTLVLTADPIYSSSGIVQLLGALFAGVLIAMAILLWPAARELLAPLKRRRSD